MKERKTPAEEALRETIEDLGERTREQLSAFEAEFRQARAFVKRNPVASVLGALALGWVLGRLFRRERVVYVERSER